MANLANGNTKTNGKFNARAVVAFHLNSASRSAKNAVVAMHGGFPNHIPKEDMRRAIELARLARTQNGIYAAGDFHPATLP